MPINARSHNFTNAVGSSEEVQLVQGSPTGNEAIIATGDFSGATLNIKSQHKDVNGVLIAGTEFIFPEDSTYTSPFAIEGSVGKNNPIIIEVTGMTATTDIQLSIRPVN